MAAGDLVYLLYLFNPCTWIICKNKYFSWRWWELSNSFLSPYSLLLTHTLTHTLELLEHTCPPSHAHLTSNHVATCSPLLPPHSPRMYTKAA